MSLRDLPLREVLEAWRDYDKDGQDLNAVRALILEDRFYLLVKVLRRQDMLHPWIYARCREVEKAPDGYLDLWSREHFKSSIITFGGLIQEVCKDPEITAAIFSHTAPIAKGFLRQIKEEMERNEVLKAVFPDIFWQDPYKEAPVWSLDAGIVVKRRTNPKEATIEAHGLIDGQPISKHYRLRVNDDVVTDKSVTTPEQIQKTTDGYSLSQALGMEGGREWGIGTRYSYADTYDWIINRGILKPRVYAATHDGTASGKPVLFSQAEWDKRQRNHTDGDIACQYLQDPLSGSQRIFNVEDLQVYEVRPETLNVYLLVDPARSVKKESANTAMVVLGLDYALNKYVLDGFDHKMDLQERWQRLRDLYMHWRTVSGVCSVRIGYEKFGAIADLDYFEERRRAEKIPGMNIEPLEHPISGEAKKNDRIQRLVPDMKGHRIYLPYATDMDKLTSNQRKMKESGYGYRIAKSIRRKDENGNLYDLCERLRNQIHFHPYGGLKDVIDALSRIYDLEPTAPMRIDESMLEPVET